MDIHALRLELAERYPQWRETIRVLELRESPEAKPVDNDGQRINYNGRLLRELPEESQRFYLAQQLLHIQLAHAASHQGMIAVDAILGAGYTQDDGYFDGTMISNTFAEKMEKNGACIKRGVEVVKINTEGGAAKSLETSEGETVDYDVIVDCTGPWSRFTGNLVGLDVPIWHTKAEAFFLVPPEKKLDYVFPVLKFPAFYALRAGDNVFICKSHLSMNLDDPMHAGQWDPDQLPQVGGTDDYFIDFLFDQMEENVPGLADSGLASSWLSYRAEPRDFLPILGETPVQNYFLCTGFGGNGVIEAPAATRDMAKLIMRGESTMLLEEWAFSRLLEEA